MSTNVMNRGTAVVGFVLSFVTGLGVMYAVDRSNGPKDGSEIGADKAGKEGGAAAAGAAWKQDAQIPISSDDPALGPKTAPVTVVIFSDYQCPYCSRVEPTLKQLREKYGEKVRFVWKDLALDFHKNALPAATAARAVYMAKGNEAFWKFHDKAFSNQQQLSDENYKAWAAELGVTGAQLDQLKTQAEARVKQNMTEAQKLGIQGTPNFMIDGEALTGAQPVDKFSATIDAHLKKAAELKGRGIADANLYAEMVKSYFKAAPEAGKGEEKEEQDDPTVWKVDIGDSPVLGKATAPVTIVVFSDFQCPFCKRVEPALKQARETYGDKIRIVWKDQPLPFHNRAIPAAMVAREARKEKGDAGFWAAHDKLFDGAPKLEDADLLAYAKDLGLDVAKVEDAIKTSKWKPEMQKDMDQAEDLQVKGTPHSFVNGRVVNGAQPFEKFKKIIDEEMAKAEAKIKAGTPAEKVYEETVKNGKGGPLPPLAIPAWAPSKGPKDAKVVIQVFSDFQCPFCKRAEVQMPAQAKPGEAAPTGGAMDPNTGGLKLALDKYGDKVRVVWRNFPLSFHNRAEPIAEFVNEVKAQKGDEAFWKAHDMLFDSQPKLEDADLQAIATKLGVDWAKCKDAMDTHKYKANIDADTKDGGSVGVTGTPGFFMGGKLLVGAQPPDAFYKAIEAALAKAK
jgi:protein-disulfide isomerase